MQPEKRAFYRWAAMQMEPWDGPGIFFKSKIYFSLI